MQFGDNVKIISNAETTQSGFDGKTGQIYGETTPSVTNVHVIGTTPRDFALNVYFAEDNRDAWFSEECLEFIDCAAGTNIAVGNTSFIRDKEGNWNEQKPPSSDQKH